MTPQELKNSILQLAIQGKLVEQRPDEGTAGELYQQIQTEKQKFFKAGTIKKENPLPEITEDEKPFDIPESWKWVRLRTIVYNRGQEVPTALFSYIDIGSIDNKNQRLNAEENLIETSEAPSRARKKVQLGDILYSTVRPYLHNMCIIDRPFSCKPIASTGFAAMTCYEGVYNKYLFFYLMSPAFDSYANHTENAKGVAYPAINDDRLYHAVVPLPPLSEQKRIVAKIAELLPHINRYEQALSKLENFNKRFPTDMQKSILQMAIQGKLVEQRPEENTGEELYQQIKAEKQKLIKIGTIHKEKPLPEITEDEKPFDIPESWKWVRFEDSVLLNTDYVANGSFASLRENVKSYKEPNYALMVKTQDFANGFRTDITYTDKHGYEFLSKSALYGGELMLSNIGASIGKAFIIPKLNIPMTLAPNSIMVKCINDIMTSYMRYMMLSFYGQSFLKTFTAGTAMPKFNKTQLRNVVIPLPPLNEQKRIVAMLEEILPLCEKLK